MGFRGSHPVIAGLQRFYKTPLLFNVQVDPQFFRRDPRFLAILVQVFLKRPRNGVNVGNVYVLRFEIWAFDS